MGEVGPHCELPALMSDITNENGDAQMLLSCAAGD